MIVIIDFIVMMMNNYCSVLFCEYPSHKQLAIIIILLYDYANTMCILINFTNSFDNFITKEAYQSNNDA